MDTSGALTMWPYVFLALLVALAVTAMYRRQLAALPLYLKVRQIADANLTGAKFSWGPYWRRKHVVALVALNLIVGDGLVLYLAALYVIDGLLFLGLFLWFSVFTFTLSWHMYYDNQLWKTRTLKLFGLGRIPWDGNAHSWERKYGKVPDRGRLTGEAPSSTYSASSKRTVQYIISEESVPDGYVGAVPKDGYIVVHPVKEGADKIKIMARREERPAPAASSESAPPSQEGAPSASEMGTGYRNGYDYEVWGIPHLYMLGNAKTDDAARWLSEKDQRFIRGLDPELRAAIYAKWPNRKPWSVVIWIQEPAGTRPSLNATDATVLLENMDLRNMLEMRREDHATAESALVRTINRMKQGR